MSGIKSPIDDALCAAIYDRLCSMVYCALNTGLDSYHDPKELRKEWRQLGSAALAHVLVLSATPHWSSYPRTFWMNPWIAQHLRGYNADQLAHIVRDWLERKPLDSRVNEDPLEADLKVRHLKNLLAALNREG